MHPDFQGIVRRCIRELKPGISEDQLGGTIDFVWIVISYASSTVRLWSAESGEREVPLDLARAVELRQTLTRYNVPFVRFVVNGGTVGRATLTPAMN